MGIGAVPESDTESELGAGEDNIAGLEPGVLMRIGADIVVEGVVVEENEYECDRVVVAEEAVVVATAEGVATDGVFGVGK